MPKQSSLHQYVRLLAKYLAPQWRRVIVLALLLFASIGLQLVNPQILRFFIDAARASSPLDELIKAAVLFFIVALVSQGIGVIETLMSNWVSFTATNEMRADLALHCLRLDLSFHNQRTPGAMIQRINGDVSALANFLSTFVVLFIGNALFLIAVLIVLWGEEWRLGLAMTIWAIVGLFALNRIRVFALPYWKQFRQVYEGYFGFLEERLNGIEDIRSNGATAYVQSKITYWIRELYRKGRMADLMGTANVNLYLLLFITGNLIALGLGAYLFNANIISLGTVYLVFTYTGLVVIPIRQISNQLQDLQSAGASIGRIQELFDTPSQVQDRVDSSLMLPTGALSVEFADVSFRYGEGESVLDRISFRLEPRRVLGVLGRTGSGKTTLSRLLFRLYDPTSGVIRLNDVSACDVPLADLRRRIELVTQDVQLFNATVRDNLTFFDATIADEKIVRVLDRLGLGEWSKALPQGLNTVLASGGGLSAGQAQLLAFARVFLREPSLVILDEASSRLDPATEHLLENAVDLLLDHSNRTGIVIAHRLSTVQRADEILILEEGRIREYGSREELARDPGSRFYQLLQTGLEEVLA
ncbi:MAG: ABC transporter ATP-binding protein [Chloroflexi bacterium]|nr:ABC transporter ATP-binding protein [Chloroflexota bacterium]